MSNLESEAQSIDELVTVELGTDKVTVLPRGQWRSSAVEALQDGRYSRWAKGALSPESYDVWMDVDPTLDDINAMFEQWAQETGQTRNLSRASRRASNNSQKR